MMMGTSVLMPAWMFFDIYGLGPSWFSKFGPLLTANLVLLALLPLIIYGIEAQMLKVTRWLKKHVWYKNHENNNSDNIKFLEMNAGPEYEF